MANFPVVLEELSAKTENNSILIGLGISVNLMESGEGKGFNGRAFLTLEAQEVNGTWKFVGIRRPIDIALDASVLPSSCKDVFSFTKTKQSVVLRGR